MDPVVLALVLLAAALHASWNALVKAGGDPFVRLALLNVVSGLCALPLCSWSPAGRGELAVSARLGRDPLRVQRDARLRLSPGDLSHVYPIARGIAPPLVALGAWLIAGETPGRSASWRSS